MTNETKPRVERERRLTKLWVPHNGKEIAFVGPLIFEEDYESAKTKILRRKQKIPTGEEIADLVYTIHYNNPEKYTDEEMGKFIEETDELNFSTLKFNAHDCRFNGGGLWVFNKNLWTPRGVYVFRDLLPKKRRSPFMEGRISRYTEELKCYRNPSDERFLPYERFIEKLGLERRLEGGYEIQGVKFSSDENLRFVPKTRDHRWSRSDDKSFLIASFGEEGAEKLGEILKQEGGYVFGPLPREDYGITGTIISLSDIDYDKDSRMTFITDLGLEESTASALGVLKE